MKSPDKPYRTAIFNALSGVISKSVYDEVQKATDTDTLFVVMGGQRNAPNPEADQMWGRRCSIDLLIIHRTGISVSKDDMDDVSDEILEILFPSYDSFGVTEPSGWQFTNWSYESGFTQPLQLSSTESVIAKVLTITTTIIQQL